MISLSCNSETGPVIRCNLSRNCDIAAGVSLQRLHHASRRVGAAVPGRDRGSVICPGGPVSLRAASLEWRRDSNPCSFCQEGTHRARRKAGPESSNGAVSKMLSLPGDRGFESRSLQQRVACELGANSAALSQIKLAEIYADASPTWPESSIRACGWILLATASLRGAHLQSAQSAYQRACLGLTPAEIEQARSFAQSWRPCRPVLLAF
jgi:hypothetical protein